MTTVSGFKKELATMNVSEPLLVTQNGEPLYVVQDPVQYEQQQEQMALLKMVGLAERDIREARLLNQEDLFKGLSEEFRDHADND